VRGPTKAGELVHTLRTAGCRIQPQKQSIGSVTGEFVRMAITQECARGYLARSVASVVSGSWVNERGLQATEKVQTLLSSAAALRNRSMNINAALVLIEPVLGVLGVKRSVAEELLRGAASVGDGPVFSGGPAVRQLHIKKIDLIERQQVDLLTCNATTDYLSGCITEVERKCLQLVGSSIKRLMLEASYAKSLTEAMGDSKPVRIAVRYTKYTVAPGSELSNTVLRRKKIRGWLSDYPVLYLLKGKIKNQVLRQLLEWVGAPTNGDLDVIAWGAEAQGVRIVGALPYSDAAAICSRTTRGVVYVSYNVYM